MRAGLAYVRRERELGVPLLMMAIMGCFTYEFQVTLPYLARTTFDGDSRTYGFMTAAMGLGAVLGGLYTAARGRTGHPARWSARPCCSGSSCWDRRWPRPRASALLLLVAVGRPACR